MTKNNGAVAEVLDELTASLEQNFRRPVNQVIAQIEEIRAMATQFARQDDAILAVKLREALGPQFSEDLAGFNSLKKSFDNLGNNLKALRAVLAGMRGK